MTILQQELIQRIEDHLSAYVPDRDMRARSKWRKLLETVRGNSTGMEYPAIESWYDEVDDEDSAKELLSEVLSLQDGMEYACTAKPSDMETAK